MAPSYMERQHHPALRGAVKPSVEKFGVQYATRANACEIYYLMRLR